MAKSADRTVASESEFSDLALELFALQFEHVAIFRQFCEARGCEPSRVSRWSQVPALPTRAFQDFEVTSVPEPDRACVFLSSGTMSQRRSRHYHSRESLGVYDESLLRWFLPHLVPELAGAQGGLRRHPSRFLVLAPRAVDAPGSSLVHMFETVARKIAPAQAEFVGSVSRDGGWTVSTEAAVRCLQASSRDGEPMVLLGTAFSFVHLLDDLNRSGRRFELPSRSRVMETGGYKGRSRTLAGEELHALISASLGIPRAMIVREYGMSELSSQAYDRVAGQTQASMTGGAGPAFQLPPWARARVVSPESGQEVEDGQTGILQIYDLANFASVLAVQTEDLAARRGPHFQLLGRAAEAQPRGCSLMMNPTEYEPA